jgi:hypothetical protein
VACSTHGGDWLDFTVILFILVSCGNDGISALKFLIADLAFLYLTLDYRCDQTVLSLVLDELTIRFLLNLISVVSKCCKHEIISYPVLAYKISTGERIFEACQHIALMSYLLIMSLNERMMSQF